ncbi:hypothetical protein [uncultured Victivallis sp.]|uniref:hypothetical protein n=1 Tax=uncultured Victivallis sp. TaxID=354118 RepID=UPI002598C0F7|nr:hypothetical protein [uncultured Victivallis sp.]
MDNRNRAGQLTRESFNFPRLRPWAQESCAPFHPIRCRIFHGNVLLGLHAPAAGKPTIYPETTGENLNLVNTPAYRVRNLDSQLQKSLQSLLGSEPPVSGGTMSGNGIKFLGERRTEGNAGIRLPSEVEQLRNGPISPDGRTHCNDNQPHRRFPAGRLLISIEHGNGRPIEHGACSDETIKQTATAFPAYPYGLERLTSTQDTTINNDQFFFKERL